MIQTESQAFFSAFSAKIHGKRLVSLLLIPAI